MKRLHDLLGSEHPLDFNSRALRDFARTQQAATVGAMHVTCSDESERECAESFQHWFAQDLLPELKYSAQSTFRTASMGGRYEWGSIRIADANFTTLSARDSFKLLVVKVNSHVCVSRDGTDFQYGTMLRYDDTSRFCGALHLMLDGVQLPALASLRESFQSEGKDRLAMLNDPQQVDPKYRSLLVAVLSARLQARRAVLDIQNLQPACPTLFVVLPCVTMNRPDRDTELLVGMYQADLRNVEPAISYRGLGDNPAAYRVTTRHNMVQIEDEGLSHDRPARDHRQLVLRQWRQRDEEVLIDDERMHDIVVLTGQGESTSGAVAKEVLKTLLRLLADVALVPTAVLLFADGIVGIHNVYRAYRLAEGQGTPRDATDILDEIMHRVDSLSPAQARYVIQLLCKNYGISVEADDIEELEPGSAVVEEFGEIVEAELEPLPSEEQESIQASVASDSVASDDEVIEAGLVEITDETASIDLEEMTKPIEIHDDPIDADIVRE